MPRPFHALPDGVKTLYMKHVSQVVRRVDGVSAAIAVLLAASLVPIWIVRYHPISDLANHLAAASVWMHLHDPSWDVSQYYARSIGLNPYWGYYAPMRVLGPIVGIDVANRLVLSAYVISLPLGFAWLLRRFDRSPALALFSFPFLWTFSLTHGFIHTCLGLGLCPAAIAAFDAYCELPTLRRGVVAFFLGGAIYFCHIVPFLLFLGCAGLIGLLHQGSVLDLLKRALVWSAVLAVAIIVVNFGRGKGMGVPARYYAFSWDDHPLTQLTHLYEWSFNNCTGHEDEVLFGLLVVAWIVLLATSRSLPKSALELRPYACALAALLGYVMLPRTVVEPAYSWGIKYRIAPFALLFLVLTIPGAILGWRRAVLALVFCSGMGFAIDTTVHWRAAQKFTAGFDETVSAIPMGKRAVFVLGLPLGIDAVRQKYVQSWPSYYQAFHGGFNPWLFDDFPLRYRVVYPSPDLRRMDFHWNEDARYYDYVVLFERDPHEVFGPHIVQVRLVRHVGKWAVYALPGPRVDLPAEQ